MNRKKTSDFDQELLDLYDGYAHGLIERREFLNKASKFAVGGITAAATRGSRGSSSSTRHPMAMGPFADT